MRNKSSIAEQANERKGAFEEPRPKWTRPLVLSTNAKFIRRTDFDTAQYISLPSFSSHYQLSSRFSKFY